MDSSNSTFSYEAYFRLLGSQVTRCVALQSALEQAVKLLTSCDFIYTFGVGKMGYIAGKSAASLRSVGLNATHIDATECAHGDLGAIVPNSVALLFSKSGNSQELVFCLPHLAERNVRLVLITSNHRSPLANAAAVTLDMAIASEGDRHNVLPLISTEIALALADSMIAAIAELRGFTRASFARNHPAGQIGMNLTRRIRDVLGWRKKRPFVGASDTLLEAMAIASRDQCGMACVLSPTQQLLGVVTDGDIRRSMLSGKISASTLVCDVMNCAPKAIDSDMLMADAYELFEKSERKIIALPVLENNVCEGVMTVHDLFR